MIQEKTLKCFHVFTLTVLTLENLVGLFSPFTIWYLSPQWQSSFRTFLIWSNLKNGCFPLFPLCKLYNQCSKKLLSPEKCSADAMNVLHRCSEYAPQMQWVCSIGAVGVLHRCCECVQQVSQVCSIGAVHVVRQKSEWGLLPTTSFLFPPPPCCLLGQCL